MPPSLLVPLWWRLVLKFWNNYVDPPSPKLELQPNWNALTIPEMSISTFLTPEMFFLGEQN